MMEAATPIKPKKGAEVGQSSEMVKSNTVESILESGPQSASGKMIFEE